MTEREQRVVALLRALDDWVPGPKTSTGQLVSALAKPGAQRVEWFECPRCVGRGKLGAGRGERACDRCEGRGRIVENAYTIDAPRRTSVPEGGHMERRRSSERELWRLELADKHQRGEIDPAEKEPWEVAKEALERAGHFAELRAALEELREESVYDYAAVRVVYGGDSELRQVGPALQKRVDAAVEWLAGRMPREIKVPASVEVAGGTGRWANEGAQKRRDREIWRLHTVDGLNREQIARRLGVDRSTVSRVLGSKAA